MGVCAVPSWALTSATQTISAGFIASGESLYDPAPHIGILPLITSIDGNTGDDYITLNYNTGIQLDGGDYTDGFTIIVNGDTAGLNYIQSQSSPSSGYIVFRLTQSPEKPLSDGDEITWSYNAASGSVVSVDGSVPAPTQADIYTVSNGLTYKETFQGWYSNGISEDLNSANNEPIRSSNADFSFWGSGGATKMVEISTIASYDASGGLSSVSVPTNPAISVSDVPQDRTGDIAHGAIYFPYGTGTNFWWKENKFSMKNDSPALDGRLGVEEAWIQYDQFIPSNFKDLPGGGGTGSKQFVFYPTQSLYGEPEYVMGRYPDGSGDGSSVFRGEHRHNEGGTYIFEWMWPDGPDFRDIVPHIKIGVDDGTWQRVTHHVKVATTQSSNDGAMEIWVKHGDGTVVQHGTQTSLDNRDDVTPYYREGYLWGFSNNGFGEATSILITNFILTEDVEEIDKTATTL